MNGKQARKLRKLLGDNLAGMPVVNYVEVNQREKLYPVGVNVDGTTRFYPVVVGTRILNGCQRQAYQNVKKLHRAYHTR
tara:strand:- start:603 stop:839 length:237 start_codon:yes stop_codon:yes gene_type:complete